MQKEADLIITSLQGGSVWHEQAALACFGLGLRGLGRWHEAEACGDAKTRFCLRKYLIDNHGIYASIDNSQIVRAYSYAIPDVGQLENHLNQWLTQEEKFIGNLKTSIASLGAEKAYDVYKMLCCHLEEVMNETLYVNILLKNLKFNAFSPHHVTQKMEVIHRYFECEYKHGDRIDFVIT